MLNLSNDNMKNLVRKQLYFNLAGFEVIEALQDAYDHKKDPETKAYFLKKSKQMNLISCQIHKMMKELIEGMSNDQKKILQKYHNELKELRIKLDEKYK